jgi:hypothetical protein
MKTGPSQKLYLKIYLINNLHRTKNHTHKDEDNQNTWNGMPKMQTNRNDCTQSSFRE